MQCVFHGIRFKVNNEDWLSGDNLFFFISYSKGFSLSLYAIGDSSSVAFSYGIRLYEKAEVTSEKSNVTGHSIAGVEPDSLADFTTSLFLPLIGC
ncbi:MAG: hypothetical protein LBH58_09410 [Tannerellaceae bacterium]|nr:hypothetical protein [Tannerellaceae bacterium]